MTAVKYEIPLLLSSDTTSGASNVSADGSRFTVIFDEVLEIPADAVNCTLRSDKQTIWWTVPNIITGTNDTFYIDVNGTPYVVVVDQGLYDLPALNSAIDRELVNQGADTGIIDLIEDNSSQKVIIRYNVVNTQVDFTQAQTFRDLMGFNSRLSPLVPSAVVGETDTADNIAAFNTVEYFLISTDLISQGIRLNNYYSNTVVQVFIDVEPGSQITSNPFNPTRVAASNLIGTSRKSVDVWLTDQNNNPVNTNGEIFSLSLILEYTLLVSRPDVN